MRYEPGPSPQTGEDTLAYVLQEFRNIAAAFTEVEEILLVELNVEPDKPRDGMVVLADGTNWNPGSGQGMYGRIGGAWVQIG